MIEFLIHAGYGTALAMLVIAIDVLRQRLARRRALTPDSISPHPPITPSPYRANAEPPPLVVVRECSETEKARLEFWRKKIEGLHKASAHYSDLLVKGHLSAGNHAKEQEILRAELEEACAHLDGIFR